jgi:DNA invertase Pin-like site-specific DNA recombinase
MTTPDLTISGHTKVTPHHTQRIAYVYIRQSSPGQVLHHKESQINQARMADYATALGWTTDQVRILTSDQGLTGATSQGRDGFHELISEVTLGQVGIIFGYEVSRLARNNADWHRLLEIAAVFDTLIGDFDGIYDLSLFNDRLLLGLKGTMSEAELHLLRIRLDEGRARQLERGEYRQGLPTGLIRLADGTVVKDPDDQIRHAIELVLDQFAQLGSCRRVVAYLNEYTITLPRRQMWGSEQGQVVWKPAALSAVYAIVTNPAYAGALVFGRRPVDPHWRYRETRTTAQAPRMFKPLEEWEVVHQDVYPAYITWDIYLANQAQLRQNRTRFWGATTTIQGAAREGSGLLQGLVLCGKCGHHLATIYKPEPRYVCQNLARRFGQSSCLFVNGPRVDQLVVQAFFEVLQPAQLDVLETVLNDQAAEQANLLQQWTDQVKRAQYEAHLAARQYHAVDPDNRLVAAELERRWESRLRQLQEVEAAYAHYQQHLPSLALSPELCDQFRHIAQTLPALWDDLQAEQKKDLLRSLIASVVLTRLAADKLEVKIVWVSGHFSTQQLRLPTRHNRHLPNYDQMMTRLEQLWLQDYSDAEIAAQLIAEGFHSARSAGLSAATIKGFRHLHGWYRPNHPPVVAPDGYLKLTEVAARLQVSFGWVYYHLGQIDPQDVTRHPQYNTILVRDDLAVLDVLRQFI